MKRMFEYAKSRFIWLIIIAIACVFLIANCSSGADGITRCADGICTTHCLSRL